MNLLPSSYTQLSHTDRNYHSILLQARSLKAQLFRYEENIATTSQFDPLVYTSSNAAEHPIVIDTGASCSITPTISDFDGCIKTSSVDGLNQLSGRTPVVGEGQITWQIEDVAGTKHSIGTYAYYVPSASIRLFSPQIYINEAGKGKLVLARSGVTFTLKCGTILKFPLNRQSNLPFMLTMKALNAHRHRQCSHFQAFHLSVTLFQAPLIQYTAHNGSQHAFNSLTTRSVLCRDNFNLHPFQQELLLWHCRLGHANFQRIQSLLSPPSQTKGAQSCGELPLLLVTPSLKGTSNCKPPRCEACQYAKQKRTTPLNIKHPSPDVEEGALTRNQLRPGDRASCDQYISTTLGRLSHTQGKEAKSSQLVGGTMFVNHATNFIFHRHQVNLTAAESVRSKHACERLFQEHGSTIRHYASDNHPFSSK